MKLDKFYCLEFSDYFYIFIAIFTMFWPVHPTAFFRCFMLNLGAYAEIQIKPFI